MNYLAVKNCRRDLRPSVGRSRVHAGKSFYSFHCPIVMCDVVNESAVEAVNGTHVSTTKPSRALRDRVEHRLGICRRTADDVEHFAGGSLVFERFLQLPFARL